MAAVDNQRHATASMETEDVVVNTALAISALILIKNVVKRLRKLD